MWFVAPVSPSQRGETQSRQVSIDAGESET